jgi:ribose 5-phosphate isomerase B
MPNVYFASDHAGFELKKKLIAYLRELGYATHDCGAYSFNPEDDYPDFIIPCAQEVSVDATSFGIIIGKSGEGEAMCANRVKGIRAAVFYGGKTEIIQFIREHNNANILSLSAQFLTEAEARDAVKKFLETPFSTSARHARRLAKF